MSDPFIGQITAFSFTFAPRNWSYCQGQIMNIGSNSALFSLLGTTYGGDGRSTFKLPDFRSKIALHAGTGPGLSRRNLGDFGGAASQSLNTHQMPSHTHDIEIEFGPNADSINATGNYLPSNGPRYNAQSTSGTALAGVGNNGESGEKGGDITHPNEMPYLAINYCISLGGAYPARS